VRGFVRIAVRETLIATERPDFGGLHGFSNPVAHEPSRAIGAEAEHPLQLERAHAFLAGGHDVGRHEPLMERDMRAAENSFAADRELVAAIVAQKHTSLGFAAHAMDVDGTAKRAVHAVRPAIGFHMGRGLGFIVKNRVGEVDIHSGTPVLPPLSHIPDAKSSA
jgi:hypothetical protein